MSGIWIGGVLGVGRRRRKKLKGRGVSNIYHDLPYCYGTTPRTVLDRAVRGSSSIDPIIPASLARTDGEVELGADAAIPHACRQMQVQS